MTRSISLEILKEAILLETRGRAFYQKVADQSDEKATKEFFQFMADEEKSHIQLLAEQYKNYIATQKFSPAKTQPQDDTLSGAVLSKEIKNKIAAAGFESAAISAAMAMEERAIRIYSEQADRATDAEEVKLYRWLSNWEKEHLKLLRDIDRDVTESVWNDNQFWPL